MTAMYCGFFHIITKKGGICINKRVLKYLGSGWRKYFLVAALIIVVLFCVFYAYAYPAYEEARVKEKAWDRQQEVNLLAGIVDLLVENEGTAGGVNYEQVLSYSMRYIETEFTSTFAQLYAEEDGELIPLLVLSPGVAGGQKHNPLDYPEFVEAALNNESGSLTYWYETPQAGGRYVYMTYRWVPTDASHATRYLIAVAISKYSVSEQIASIIKIGTLALIVVTVLFILAASVLFCRLGYIYEQRDGEKWRCENDSE